MLPFDTQIATVVRQSNIGTDTTYEPLLRVDFDINDRRSTRRAAHGAGTGADPNPMHYPADNNVY